MNSLPAIPGLPAFARLKSRSLALPMLVACLLLVATPAARGQLTNVDDATSTPIEGVGHNYIKMLSETVNPANGSVSLRIQLPVPEGRGITPSFSIDYDSNSVNHVEPGGTPGYPIWQSNAASSVAPTPGGWSFSLPSLSFSESDVSHPSGAYDDNGYEIYYTCSTFGNYMFTDMSGQQHALNIGTEYDPSSSPDPGCSDPFPYGGDPQVQAYLASYQPSSPPSTPASARELPVKVYTPDGTVYTFGQTSAPSGGTFLPTLVEDRNGNELSFHDYGPYGTAVLDQIAVVDTAGRTVLSAPGLLSGGTSETLTVGGLTYTIYWTTISAYATLPSKFVGSSVDYCPGGFPTLSNGNQQPLTQQAISEILLPNGQSYKFYYESNYGLLREIDYPSGAWVRYTYSYSAAPNYNMLANLPGLSVQVIQCVGGGSGTPCPTIDPPTMNVAVPGACLYEYSSPVVATRTVGYTQGGPAVQTQTFTYTTAWDNSGTYPGTSWTAKTTTVATADDVRSGAPSANSVYTYEPFNLPDNSPVTPSGFSPQVSVEKEIDYYNYGGGAASETVIKGWQNQFLLTSSQTTMNGTQISQTAYTYNTSTSANPFNLETEKDETDYVNSSPTRTTQTNYQTFTGTPGYLVDRPSSVIVCNGGSSCSGGTISKTDYAYDGQATSPVTDLPPNTHDETNYAPNSTTPRGNITTVTRECLSGCTVPPVTRYTYDETGQVASKIDPDNYTTQFSFMDNPPGANSAGNSNAYLTQITYPTTANGIAHRESFQYNYAIGYLTQATDENGQPTNYTYADALQRPTEVQGPPDPNNNNQRPTTQISYNDNPPTPSITTTVTQSPDPTKTTVQVMDGMGHVLQTQLTDPEGTDYVNTIYDGLGQVYEQSNPTRCSSSPGAMPSSCSEPTWGFATFNYDSLGRKTSQTDTDGVSTQAWSYSGSTVTNTDENGNQWQRTSDGFGRLIKVLEPNGAAKGPSMETDYQYDALNNLLNVTQWGGPVNSSGARVRTFSYDSLSRLVCASNPENSTAGCPVTPSSSYVPGTTGYSYDADGNLVSKTDARGITTSYSYDELNRLLSKSYSSDASQTPFSCFQYDTSSVSGAGGNLIGRLTNEWTIAAGSSCSATAPPGGSYYALRSILSYDGMGRILNEQQCTPSKCTSGSGPTVSYGYDLAGNPTGLMNSAGAATEPGPATMPLILTTAFDEAGHVNSVTSNWTAFPTNLFTAASTNGYAPFGGTQNWSQGPSLSVQRGYTNRLWVNSISATGQVP